MINKIKSRISLFKDMGFQSGFRLNMVFLLKDISGIKVADHWLQEWNLWSEYGVYKDKDARYDYIKQRNKKIG